MLNKKFTYRLNDCFLVRTPFISLTEWYHLFDGDFRINLKDFFLQSDLAKQNLYLSSPEFFETVSNCKEDLPEQVLATLAKYASRYSTRAIPFGLFSGVNLGSFQSDDSGSEFKRAKIVIRNRILRIDNEYIFSIIDNLLNNETIYDKLKFVSNNTFYKIGKCFYYVEYTTNSVGKRSYKINKLQNQKTLFQLIDFAKNEVSYQQVEAFFVSLGAEPPDIPSIIQSLLREQILFTNFQPCVTDPFTLQRIHNLLTDSGLKDAFFIEKLIEKVNYYNSDKEGDYKSLMELKALINDEKSPNLKHLFQVDYITDYEEYRIDHNTRNQIQETIDFLSIFPGNKSAHAITTFQQVFFETYGFEEVPLSVAIDPIAGIGFPFKNYGKVSVSDNPLDTIVFPQTILKNETVKWNQFDQIVFQKYLEYVEQNDIKQSIELSLSDFEGELGELKNQTGFFAAMVHFINKKDTDDLQLYFKGTGSNTPFHLLGRFAYLDDNIRRLLIDIATRQDKDEASIQAVILNFPENRLGNVIQHPPILKYEIPIFSGSVVDAEYIVHIDDLYLKILNQKLILFSKRLKKRVIPRLFNAHVYSNSDLPIYWFLADYEHYLNKSSFHSFQWPTILQNQPFLPRVTFKKSIISKASWTITQSEVKIVSIQDGLDEFTKWRNKRKIPQFVVLVEGDKELVLNLNEKIYVSILLKQLRKFSRIVLSESLIEDRMTNVDDTSHINELILIFERNEN